MLEIYILSMFCQSKLFALPLRIMQIRFTIYRGGGGGWLHFVNIHMLLPTVELHDIELILRSPELNFSTHAIATLCRVWSSKVMENSGVWCIFPYSIIKVQ